MLAQVTLILATAVVIVTVFKRLGLGTVLGYLVAGMLLGPFGINTISDVHDVLAISELGVVMLLFVIGLELQPSRLWVLRRAIFGLGTAQVLATTVVIAAIGTMAGQSLVTSIIIGFALALSSTAFVLQTLAERRELTAQHGRDAFAILLFQDLSVIPVLAVLPLLAVEATASAGADPWIDVVRALLVIASMIGAGRPLLRQVFRLVARHGNRELFTATALLVVIGAALLMHQLKLSMSLGAFLAGILLADSEFRHEIEADLEPFKGLLLGLFFIGVGMTVNFDIVLAQPLMLLLLAVTLCLIKFAVVWSIGRAMGASGESSRNLGIALAAGGEFAFVLFALAQSQQLLSEEIAQILTAVVTLSMILAPALFVLNDRVLSRWGRREAAPDYDTIDEPGNPVVIAGFGRFGQIVARILRMRGIAFTALESSPAQIDFVRRFGNRIYYGDASRLELLHAAKVEQARVFVLAIGDVETSLKIARTLRRHFPHVPIYARARNRMHCFQLMDLGIRVMQRDTYHSSLAMARDVLQGLGVHADEAERSVGLFRNFDEELLQRQHAIKDDEAALIQDAKQAAIDLRALFEADAAADFGRLAQPGNR
jgi:glutathione-regulated potassium-efflux system ancillary protein KefC/glutathione-regulated potassium-efflux system protein KefB